MNVPRPELERLIRELREGYDASPSGEKMTTLHLFGIVHAEELARLDTGDLEAVASGAGSPSFATELRRMVKLSRFVEPRRAAGGEDELLSTVFTRHAKAFPAGFRFDRDEANAR